MNSRFLSMSSALLIATTLFSPARLCADSVRVASWNLAESDSTNPIGFAAEPGQLKAVAATLKKIDPDIVLLQHVRDWRTCSGLAQALRPVEYHVVICSSFHSAGSKSLAQDQVAILSREPAYFSWSENWRSKASEVPPGGFAFAALRFGSYRIGVFSVQLDQGLASDADSASDLQARRAGLRQLADQVGFIRKWSTNRVQFFALGGPLKNPAFNLMEQTQAFRPLREAGFEDAWLDAPPNQKSTLRAVAGHRNGPIDFIFATPFGSATRARVWRLAGADRFPFSCDLELDRDKIAAAAVARREAAALKAAARSNQLFQARSQSNAVATQAQSPQLVPKMTNAGPALKPVDPGAVNTNTGGPSMQRPAPAAATMRNRAAAKAFVSRSWVSWSAVIGVAVVAVGLLVVSRRRSRLQKAPKLIPETFEENVVPDATAYVVVKPRSVTTSATEVVDSVEPKPFIHVENPAAAVTHSESSFAQIKSEESAMRQPGAVSGSERFELLQWLKQLFVQRLLSDRAGLLKANQEAAKSVEAVDQRLNRIEQQVREQNRLYQHRIEELTIDLAAAKEGNRELIRAKISQLRTEMETSRARLLEKEK